ncbi:MAG TPA: glycoside hydrolase family 16 protein [Solirubrobacteraceae bacterium]|nr:glycoside hydrolase family 16 protein [Solirubrobacteraceae bacterium]
MTLRKTPTAFLGSAASAAVLALTLLAPAPSLAARIRTPPIRTTTTPTTTTPTTTTPTTTTPTPTTTTTTTTPTTTTTTTPTTTTSTATSTTCGSESLPAKPGGGQWACSFDDEFNATTGDASTLNTSWWTPTVTATSGYFTGSLPYPVCYVNSPNNISVSGGALHLTVRETTTPYNCGGYPTYFTGGMVTSVNSLNQTYGRFEVSALLPQSTAEGLQETLWLYPKTLAYGAWPASGEVDFSEFYSEYSSLDVPYIHYNYNSATTNPATNTNVVTAYCPISLTQYNAYAVTWEPGSFTITINGNVCLIDNYQADGGLSGAQPFNQPMFMALTQALGAAGSDQFTQGVTQLPATTSIKYVRAWK